MTFMTILLHVIFSFLFLLVVDISLSIRENTLTVIYVAITYIEIPCRVLSMVNPEQTAKLFGATEFLQQQRLVSAMPSTRHIKSAGLLSQRVGSSTGIKYRFSIGHSLTLGRFRIKLPGLRRECGLYSSHSFKPAPVS